MPKLMDAESKDGASALDAAVDVIENLLPLAVKEYDNLCRKINEWSGNEDIEAWEVINSANAIIAAHKSSNLSNKPNSCSNSHDKSHHATQRSSQGDKNYSPRIAHITQWDDEHDINLECRFDDGQKFAAVRVSRPMKDLADYIQRCLLAPLPSPPTPVGHVSNLPAEREAQGELAAPETPNIIDKSISYSQTIHKPQPVPVMSPEGLIEELELNHLANHGGCVIYTTAIDLIRERDAALRQQWEGEEQGAAAAKKKCGLKVLTNGSVQIGIDGNAWFVSNALDLGDPRARFVFNTSLRKALDEWNTKYPKEYLYPEREVFLPWLDKPADDFLHDEATGEWL